VAVVDAVGFVVVVGVGEEGPVVDDQEVGRGGSGGGIASGVAEGFDQVGQGDVVIGVESPGGLGSREGAGHAGEGVQPRRQVLRGLDLLRDQGLVS
jgi:hypothetical protein